MRKRTCDQSRNKTNVLVDEVEATISWHETSDLLSVLDQLHTDTLTDGRVGLFGLKTTGRLIKMSFLELKDIYDISHIFSTTIPLDMHEPPRGLAFM